MIVIAEGDCVKKIAWIIYNPESGKKTFQDSIKIVENRLISIGYDTTLYKTKYIGHAKRIARASCEAHVDLLVVSGGDGTVNEVINGIANANHRPTLACLPSGTTNDFARNLGMKHSLEANLDIIENHTQCAIDIMEGSKGYIAYVTALGNYVDISFETPSKWKRKLGFLAYLISGVRKFFTMPRIKTTIVHDGGVARGYFSLILAVNTRYVASFKLFKKTDLNDGKIDIIALKYIPFFNNILFAAFFLLKLKRLPGMRHIKTTEATIDPITTRRWSNDGEAGLAGKIHIKNRHRHIHVIVDESVAKMCFNGDDSNV